MHNGERIQGQPYKAPQHNTIACIYYQTKDASKKKYMYRCMYGNIIIEMDIFE